MKTRTTIAALLAVGMFLSLAGLAQANLIHNPGFEADFDGDANPDNWTKTGTGWVKDPDLGINPYEGSLQFQLQSTGTLTQQVVLPAAGQYDLGMWIASRPDASHHLGPIANNEVKLQLRDASNVVVAPDSAVTGDYDSPRGTYVEWARTYNSLAVGTYTVELRSDGPGAGANQGMVDAFSLTGPPAPPNLIQNPGCLFTVGGHTDGDNGGHVTLIPANMPNWDTSVGAPYFSDPQGIFNYTTEYTQIQATATNDLYQHVTVGSSGAALLSIEGMHRNDNVFPAGTIFADLYAGTLTSFGTATPITPDSSVWPSLSNSIQTFSHTYDSLAAGNYTVRMGGTRTAGNLFQAGTDNISLTVREADDIIPEPATLGMLGLAITGLGGYIRKRRRACR